MLVSTSIPNLLSGVSQQPASMRFPSQAEKQVNAYPSVIDGLIKRPPTEHVVKLVNGLAGQCHCHIINRDSTERYAVVFRSNQTPLVYDIVNGNFETVSTPDGVSYLTTSNPDQDLRVVTVADYTFITNKNVETALLPSRTLNRGQECLITVMSGQYGCTYTITFPDGVTTREYSVTTLNGGDPSHATDIATDLIASRLAGQMTDAVSGLNAGGTSTPFTSILSGGQFGQILAKNGKVYITTDNASGLGVSSDGGTTFSYRTAANSGLNANAIVCVEAQADTVYAGTSAGVFVSTNGGTSFELKYSRVARDIYASGNNLYVATDTLYGITSTGVAISSDGGNTFTSRTTANGLGSNNTNAVWGDGTTVYVGTDSGLSVSTNNGDTFVNRTFPGDTSKVNAIFVDEATDRLYVAVGDVVDGNRVGSLFMSKDRGETFTSLFSSTTIQALSVFATGNTIYLGTWSQGLLVSQDGGQTFSQAANMSVATTSVSRDGGNVYAVTTLGVLKSQLPGVQGFTDWLVSREGSTIWIRRGVSQPYGAFEVPEITDSRNNTLTTFAGSEVQNLVDLPLVAPNGYVAKVIGDPDAVEDEYFVEFVSNSGGFGAGLWEETVAPNTKYQIDSSTMPHILVRKQDGGFEFRRGAWESRTTGDELSSPEPSFIGRVIKDIFFFKNRLGLLADDKVVLSEAGQYFNFWRTSVLQVLDGDPIDLGVAHTKVAILNAAVPFSENLVLFSDQTQFLLSSGGDLLTPKTASITQTTEFRSLASCRPVTNGKAVFFAEGRGNYSAVREYFQTATDSKIFDAENLTQQVSAYIRGEVQEIEPSTHDNIVFVRSSGSVDTLYGYKYLMNGTNRIQSAWFEFVFPESNLRGIGWIDTSLYMFNQRGDGLHLERMRIEPGFRDTELPFVVHLDRRRASSAVNNLATPSIPQSSISYNPLTGTTSITLPYEIRSGATMQVVSVDGLKETDPPAVHPLGKIARVVSVSQDKTTLVVDENWTNVPFYVGEKYEMVYQTSTPYIRQGESNVIVPQGRFQLTYGEIVFTNSTYFVVEVTPKYRDTFYYPFTGNILGATAQVDVAPVVSGSFRFPVFAKNDEVTITIRNDSPLPCGLTSIDYEATYNTRSRRI